MAECTIEELILGMVNAARNNPRFVKMVNETSPMLDVTDILQKYYTNVKNAYLTIYGDPSRVRVLYKTATQPPAQTEQQMIYNWQNGIELERQFCIKENLYYLVQYPAKLDVETTDGSTTTNTALIALLAIGAVGLILMGDRR